MPGPGGADVRSRAGEERPGRSLRSPGAKVSIRAILTNCGSGGRHHPDGSGVGRRRAAASTR
eukprot:4900044-Alexandrium_andersonii.AAC.1